MRKTASVLVTAIAASVLVLAACSPGGDTGPTGQTGTRPATVSPGTPNVSATSGATSSGISRPAPAIPPVVPPASFIKNRATAANTEYVVFAWNDLGMHCANPDYDTAVLLPPYNTIWAQVLKRGNPPQIVTAGLTVEYKFTNNTYSYGKGSFGQFWDNMKATFGVELPKNKGLNLADPDIHNGLSGAMVAKGDHFVADGVPLTPINDDGSWNPFQIAEITVKDASGKVVASTKATAPVSDEFNCAKCHGADAFADILQKHDKLNGTNLVNSKPVLCAGCHGDPALRKPDPGAGHYLSDRIHGFHATVNPQPTCYDCHPGQQTQCSRSLAHTAPDGKCTACHGDLANVSKSIQDGRIPWANEPECVTCHNKVAEVDTGSVLYRNAKGHGGVYCASCHSSPHATVKSRLLTDNYQALQYQGAAVTIGSCGACHPNSRGRGGDEFSETHGGLNPKVTNACGVCHTAISADTTKWPHSFQWKARQGTGTARDDD